jgi:hypothetical protein
MMSRLRAYTSQLGCKIFEPSTRYSNEFLMDAILVDAAFAKFALAKTILDQVIVRGGLLSTCIESRKLSLSCIGSYYDFFICLQSTGVHSISATAISAATRPSAQASRQHVCSAKFLVTFKQLSSRLLCLQ